ncbi:MAG: RNA polymerase sigma factor [Bacteroidota bacterium]
MDQSDEQELIREFNRGNDQAFNQLVLRYQEKVYWIVRRMISDHDEANDLTQNIFIKAYHSLYSFKGNSTFYTWLYRIAVNLTLNEIRRKKIRQIFSLEREEPLQIASKDDQPLEQLEKSEQKMIIRQAIDRLPEKQKLVFVLRYYEELPYDEISKILKTSVGGLKANYFHAVRNIGKFLKHEL